ncbi:hypothetical protein [Streptomyces sp. MBT33]|uniref:hypothetical protein n=1 Tax=Streptomyces sp. MBT33 TaxID=1488363 RepID=UPI00190E4F42|nr:hypothetical protein [Streptomyces sp. MBT33]MBK3639524.1 hypothetical protein [Streptomyces sp. MBT33]
MKSKLSPLPNDRNSRLIVSVAVGLLVFGLVVLFALLVAEVDVDDDSTSRRCPGYAVGTVDPVTCLPYGSSGTAVSTNQSGSSGSSPRKPAQAQPKAPVAKPPAAPKAPAAPAVKAPAPPPVRLTK